MRRPTIGITSYWRHAVMDAWALDAAFIAQGYVEGIRLGGGRAIVLPPDPLWADDPGDVLDMLAGLVVAGGEDVGPELYGHDRHPSTGPKHDRRDGARFCIGVLWHPEADVPGSGRPLFDALVSSAR